jgi:amino acid transporter
LHKKEQKNKELTKRFLIKSFIISSLLISINLIWYLIFFNDFMLSINLGIITPIIYGIFYFIVKKSRRKLKSKIKSFIYIPIIYTVLGLFWLTLSLAIEKFTSSEVQNQKNTTVIEKLEFKHFFLFNHNLSYPSRIISEVEMKAWKHSDITSQEMLTSKHQTNNIILFSFLFIIQSIVIYITENKIYPKFRPEHVKKNRRRHRKAPRDTFISNEEELFLNFGKKSRKELNELEETESEINKEEPIQKFPKL